MKSESGSVSIPLPRGQLTLILTLGILLSTYLITLITNYHDSQEKLELASIEQLRLETENRAAELAFFFSDAISTITTLSESRELSIYFTNKALKMSMKYGLEANLMSLAERFRGALNKAQDGRASIFSRIAFISEQGEPLTDTEPDPAADNTDWASYLTPEIRGAQLISNSQETPFLITQSYFFKNRFKGQLLAWISWPSVLEHLVLRDRILQDAVYSWDGRLLAGGDIWNDLLPPNSEAAKTIASMIHGATVPFSTTTKNGIHDILAVKVLLPGIDYYLVTLHTQERNFSQATSQAMLFAVAALPLLATIGLLFFLHMRRINETLRGRYIESLQQRQILANEVVNRKAAEQELWTNQQQVIQHSSELKKTMAALLESQQMLSEAQRIAHLGSWKFDCRVNRLTWSDEVYRIFGLNPGTEEASHELFLNSVHPDDRERVESRRHTKLTGANPPRAA